MKNLPSKFGSFGGAFVPEVLVPALMELEEVYQQACADEVFSAGISGLLRNYVGRPTPISYAGRLTAHLGGHRSTSSARIWRTPARTRSITRLARHCWQSAWASAA